MAALTQGNYAPDWLLEEFGAPNFCRVEGTLASGQNLASGTVLCTNAGKYEAYDESGGGTLGDVTGILLNAVDATSGDKPCVVLARGPAVVSKAGLTWHSNNNAAEIVTGLGELLVMHIVAVEGV